MPSLVFRWLNFKPVYAEKGVPEKARWWRSHPRPSAVTTVHCILLWLVAVNRGLGTRPRVVTRYSGHVSFDRINRRWNDPH